MLQGCTASPFAAQQQQPSDPPPPTPPTGLAATASSNTQIGLTWTASTDNVGVTGYRIERCGGASCTSFAQIGTTTGATTFSNSGLTASTSYSYRVRATDAAGNAYVAGSTYSSDFPTVNALQSVYRNSGDCFVSKLNPVGSGLIYSTYLGGKNNDIGYGIAVDSLGHAYVAGQAGSGNFPKKNAFQLLVPAWTAAA